MKKMVNGKIVDMTPAEIAQRQAEDAAHRESVRNPPPRPKTEREEIAELRLRLESLERRP